ncbi:PASTA domain-containing protein [Actinoplanes sp. NPDC049316]|uniref:PASTA domain-containing protein n=1 Tax=Actinoplanes sp. NPDC049316 TaxID=3154727 RepID=UPI003426AAC0
MSGDTRESFPFGDEPPGEGGNQPNGGTRAGDTEADRTQQMPRPQTDPDGTALLPAADDSAQMPPGDRTEMMPAVEDDAAGDRTEMMPAVEDDAAGDRTEMMPAVEDDRTEMMPGVDEPAPGEPTAVLPPARGTDATAVHPPAAAGANWADEDEIWAGRAGVRAPRPADEGTDWAAVPAEEPRGRWWTPIVVGIVGLILLGLLAWGIYLIVQSTDDGGTPAPAPTATLSPAAPPTTEPTAEPTTTPPTTTQPTTTPPTSPSDITIPALRGLSLEEARAALNRSGLNYRLRYVQSTEAPPGTVIDSDPPEGQQVPDDTIINLIIAAERTTTTTTPTTTATTEPADAPEGD